MTDRERAKRITDEVRDYISGDARERITRKIMALIRRIRAREQQQLRKSRGTPSELRPYHTLGDLR